MKIECKAERLTSWELVKEVALATCGKEYAGREVTSEWKTKILTAEHSPIRALMFKLTFENLPSWVSVHFVRHKFGVEHYVQSQRDDRTGSPIPRSEIPQGALVKHVMIINAQAIINISRKRLCYQASPETHMAWKQAVTAIRGIGEVELADRCLPECLYRGGYCPEMKQCEMGRKQGVSLMQDIARAEQIVQGAPIVFEGVASMLSRMLGTGDLLGKKER